MRDEASKKLGDKFDLKRFHLLFIRQGSIPPAYFRDELLRELESNAAAVPPRP
jgi:uncharacterized protein (DUF885 family)